MAALLAILIALTGLASPNSTSGNGPPGAPAGAADFNGSGPPG